MVNSLFTLVMGCRHPSSPLGLGLGCSKLGVADWGSLGAHTQSPFVAQTSPHFRSACTLTACYSFAASHCGESRSLTAPIPQNTLPPDCRGLQSVQPRGSYSKFSSSPVFKSNTNLLFEDNTWLRASIHFLCLIFTAWGISVLAGEIKWFTSCSLTLCTLGPHSIQHRAGLLDTEGVGGAHAPEEICR